MQTIIYEDIENAESVYFDDAGALICASWTYSESGESSNVLDDNLQYALYMALKEKFDKSE